MPQPGQGKSDFGRRKWASRALSGGSTVQREQGNRGTGEQGHSESESQESPKEEAPPLASLKKGLKSATKAVGHVELLVHVLEDRDLDPSVPSGPSGPRVSAVVLKWSPP